MTTPTAVRTRPAEIAPPRPGAQAVAAQARALLAQCALLIRGIGDDAYRSTSRLIAGGTVGKHVRHCLDHFRAAIDDGLAGREIDYDHRERDTPVEAQRSAALAAIDELDARLARLEDRDLARPVSIRVMLAADGADAVLGSTLGRELAFASHHAIHHHAMIRAIAGEFGFSAAADFGKAPSTLNYEQTSRP